MRCGYSYEQCFTILLRLGLGYDALSEMYRHMVFMEDLLLPAGTFGIRNAKGQDRRGCPKRDGPFVFQEGSWRILRLRKVGVEDASVRGGECSAMVPLHRLVPGNRRVDLPHPPCLIVNDLLSSIPTDSGAFRVCASREEGPDRKRAHV